MAEESIDVLVLRDVEGNIYALPRRLVERSRVPEELKDTLPLFRRGGNRYWPSTLSTNTQAAAMTPRLPWPVGWVRVPVRSAPP